LAKFSLGDPNQRAFAYLEKEYANGAFYLNYLKVDPEVDNLRSARAPKVESRRNNRRTGCR